MLSLDAWQNLHQALEFYIREGFSYIEAPWCATPEAIDITLPKGCECTTAFTSTNRLYLVGSAEQSFLEMHLRGRIPQHTKLVTLTPCFRLDDQDPSTGHLPYFMKVELGYFFPGHVFNFSSPAFAYGPARTLRSQAQTFLQTLTGVCPQQGERPPVRVESTSQGEMQDYPLEDLEIDGVEVGSYGIRTYVSTSGKVFSWAYGTGLAEPRTSWAIARVTREANKVLRTPSSNDLLP